MTLMTETLESGFPDSLSAVQQAGVHTRVVGTGTWYLVPWYLSDQSKLDLLGVLCRIHRRNIPSKSHSDKSTFLGFRLASTFYTRNE